MNERRGGLWAKAAVVLGAVWCSAAATVAAQGGSAPAAGGDADATPAVIITPVIEADSEAADAAADVSTSPYAPPSAYLAPEPGAEAATEPDTSDRLVVGRVFAELGMSLLDALFVGALGGFAGAAIGAASCDAPFFSGCGLVGGVVGHYLVAVGTIPLAVTWAGSWLDGRGDAGWAYLGELVGAALSGVLVGVSASVRGDEGALAGTIAMVGTLLLPPIGAIVGYELADDAARASGAAPAAEAHRGPRLAPSFSFDASRAVVGLGGSF